jgi:hypothetical protein
VGCGLRASVGWAKARKSATPRSVAFRENLVFLERKEAFEKYGIVPGDRNQESPGSSELDQHGVEAVRV